MISVNSPLIERRGCCNAAMSNTRDSPMPGRARPAGSAPCNLTPRAEATSIRAESGPEFQMDEISTAQTFLEIGVGLLVLVLVIFVHGAGIRTASRRFNRNWARLDKDATHWRADAVLAVAVASLAALHLGLPCLAPARRGCP